MTRPVTAFITFSTKKHQLVALAYKAPNTNLDEIRGILVKPMKQADGPTNIIWENRHFLPEDIIKRKALSLFLIFLLLLASLVLILYFKVD